MTIGRGADVLTTEDLSRRDIEQIIGVADSLGSAVETRTSLDLLAGKILATLFFQSSTRTRLSFESAMQRLGGSVLGFADAQSSRATGERAESLEDTVRTVEHYADAIVIRHPAQGAAKRAAEVASVPVLNGGDGTNQHPSQGLLDAYTIWREKGTLDGLSIALVGDLKSTRGMHSLVYTLSNFRSRLFLVSPPELRFGDAVKARLRQRDLKFHEARSVDEVVSEVDVMYVTRLNKEGTGSAYERLLREYPRITLDTLRGCKDDLIVMHDLPRSDELGLQIDSLVDATPHAKYFSEVKYGVMVRMALLALVLGAVEPGGECL